MDKLKLPTITLAEVIVPFLGEMEMRYRHDKQLNVVAYAQMYKYIDAVVLHQVYVHPNSRGKGLATELLEEVLDYAVGILELPVILHVASSLGHASDLRNDQLRDWYLRHGFKSHASYDIEKNGSILVTV